MPLFTGCLKASSVNRPYTTGLQKGSLIEHEQFNVLSIAFAAQQVKKCMSASCTSHFLN